MVYQLIIDEIIGRWGYSKQYVRNVLSGYKGKHLDVRISSLGGDLDHGLDIRQQFVDHGDVTVYLTGFVASAATIIALGAKRICMSKYAMILVHKCSNYIDVWGNYNADEIAALIESLEANKSENEKIDVVIANLYAEKCGKKVSEILDILKAGQWMTAEEALALGLIDEITEDASDTKVNYSPELRGKFNALGLPPLPRMSADAPDSDDDTAHVIPINIDRSMKSYDFSAASGLLKLDAITPDKDNYVSVTADQFETLCGRINSLETELSAKSASLTERETKIAELEEQIKQLKELPGDDTDDIKDDAVDQGSSSKLSAQEIYNSVKNIL